MNIYSKTAKYQQKLIQYQIEKISKKFFKKNIEIDLGDILENTTADIEKVFFAEADIKHALKIAIKLTAPGPDQITTKLIESEGGILTKSFNSTNAS